MQILCILIAALIVFAPLAQARVKFPTINELAATFPPELLYKGRPIDPRLIDASNPTEGPSAEQDLNAMAPFRENTEARLWTNADGFIGVTYGCADATKECSSGMLAYKYLGLTPAGPALQTMSSSYGTGTFTSIVILKRKGDSFTTDLAQETGDRCDGGISQASVKDGKIIYAYQVTSEELYNRYKSRDGHFDGYHGSPLDCMALIHKTDDVIQSVELIRSDVQLENDLTCASFTYREQVKAHGARMTEDETRTFFKTMEQTCIDQDDGE